MKFTYNWLKQYVDFEWTPQQLAEKLTFAGMEVEDIINVGSGALEQVIVCQILSSEKHPNADKLSVCSVFDGKGERQIVCGAKNYKIGDKVPLALPGVTLPNGMTIKEAKLRGVGSQGMMCSAKELGISEDAEGLLILPADTKVGSTLSDALGGVDTVFDIEVTPNRPDWLSLIGIAREIAALTGNQLRFPEVFLRESDESVEKLASVKVDAPDLCPRYTARVIRGVKIAPSPAWLRQTLEKVGMRSINNVVDVTNYVLLECGQPLHAFDYNLLAGHQINVRRANNGELFVAIDGSKHELNSEMLVIADATRAVALAGIMGGKESEISDKTTDVLLESAWFLPPNVRRTSKRLGLSSESSYRFERGADIGAVVWASHRATQLIQDLAGGHPARGIIDALAKPIEKRRVKCRYAQVNRLLGIDVPPDTVKKIFVQLGLEIIGPTDVHACEVEVPTFRVDLEREVDLIEEVCRIHGVEKVPAKMQPSNAAVSDFDKQWDALSRVRQILTALGFDEAMNQTLVGEGEVKLTNPLNAEQQSLRSSLVPGLLGNLRTNVSRHQYDVRLFEVGRVFAGGGGESTHLALAVTGRRDPHSWELAVRNAKMDLFDVKGAIEELADSLGVAGLTFSGENVLQADKPMGTMKQISGGQAKKWDLRETAFVAELDVDVLLAAARADKEFKELPKFPAVVRDVAFVVDESIEHTAVLAGIDKSQNKILENVEIFDIFRGGSIPTGKKSVAYSLTFRAADRTLTDAEVNEAHERIKRQLQKALSCEIRES